MVRKVIVAAFIFFIFTGISGAETLTLTLEDAVNIAMSRNLSLKKAGITLQVKDRTNKKSWNALLPSISVAAGLSANQGIFAFGGDSPAGFTTPGNLGFNAGLSLTLPLNAGIGAGIKQRLADYEAGLLDFETITKELEKNVQKQFYHILANQENIRIQQANIDLAQKRYGQSLSNFESGLVSEVDVLSSQVSLSLLQPAYNRAVYIDNSMILQFKDTIGMDRNDTITLIGELPNELHDLDAEELIHKYAAGRLDIRSIEKQIEVLGYVKSAIAFNANTPTLSLGYSYGINGSNADTDIQQEPIDPWSQWNDQGTLSLQLQWNLDGLIPGSKTSVQIQDRTSSIEELRLTQAILWRSAGTEITNLVGSLLTSRLTIEANTSNVELAKKNYELTEEAYKVGTRQLLDMESAQNDYLAAQQQLIVAKYDYIAGLLDLEFALNTPMEEFLK